MIYEDILEKAITLEPILCSLREVACRFCHSILFSVTSLGTVVAIENMGLMKTFDKVCHNIPEDDMNQCKDNWVV